MEQPSEHPGADPPPPGAPEVSAELVRMLQAGELERIAGGLQRDLRIGAAEADDAVFEAVRATLEAKKPPSAQKVGSYVYTAAKRQALHDQAIRRRESFELDESWTDD